MNHFELYLDESGQFEERNKNGRPSIVAGYLMSKKCSEAWAESLFAKTKRKDASFSEIDTDQFHAMESRSAALPAFNVCLMEELQTAGGVMVVFQNGRGNRIVNSDITYLNVFAEGILKLMYHLLAHYKEEISLNITYATRLQMEEKEKSGICQSIENDDYFERIQERILLRMAHIAPNDRSRLQYRLHWGSARKSPLLMLADAVNYTLRGGVSSLSPAQKERVGALAQLRFKVLEHSGWEQIQAHITSSRWAEAVYSWYGEYDDELRELHGGEFNHLIVERLEQLGAANSRVQFEVLSNLIKILIDTRKYETANKFMDRIAQKLFPLLAQKGLLSPEADFDLHFLRLTTATHQGDVSGAEERIQICREKLARLPATWETMDYYLSYKLREAEQQKNMYDFRGAIANLDKLEQILTDAISVVQMIDELGEFGEKIKSTTLGKVLGSRVTARCYLSYETPEELALARRDSDAAMEQFHRAADKARQSMVRSMVEYLDGQFGEALLWLGRVCGVEDAAPAKLLDVFRRDKNASVFGILHYTSLMAHALQKGHPLGEELFSAWNVVPPDAIIPDQRLYPVNIILWRIGTAKAVMQPGAAEPYYKEAISVTDSNPMNLPHFMARLVMKAEYENILARSNKAKTTRSFISFERDYQKLKECRLRLPENVLDELDSFFAAAKDSGGKGEERGDPARIVGSIAIL